MSRYQTILFDLDGTLVASHESILSCLRYAFASHNIPHEHIDLTPLLGPPIYEGLKQVFPDTFLDENFLKNFIKFFRAYYADHCTDECNAYAGIPQLLATLKANNRQLLVATSKPTIFAEKILERLNLAAYFDLIVGSNLDLTRTAKSEVIAHALSNLPAQNKKQMVMIGDRSHDVVGAQGNAIDSISVAYGYGSLAELTEAKPTFLAQDVGELQKILLG